MSRHREEASSPIIVSPGALFPRNHMVRRVGGAIATAWRGILAAVRARPVAFLAISGAVLVLNVILPPLVLAVTRKPWTYFTFNPWLKKLPEYVASGGTLAVLSISSRIAAASVLILLSAAVAYLGWQLAPRPQGFGGGRRGPLRQFR